MLSSSSSNDDLEAFRGDFDAVHSDFFKIFGISPKFIGNLLFTNRNLPFDGHHNVLTFAIEIRKESDSLNKVQLNDKKGKQL